MRVVRRRATLFFLHLAAAILYNQPNMERAGYRIIDANFNRAREALRVIEDYCRFNLNCAPLSGRAKEMRHQLSSAIAQLNAGQLLANRDTPGDVGIRADNRKRDRQGGFE